MASHNIRLPGNDKRTVLLVWWVMHERTSFNPPQSQSGESSFALSYFDVCLCETSVWAFLTFQLSQNCEYMGLIFHSPLSPSLQDVTRDSGASWGVSFVLVLHVLVGFLRTYETVTWKISAQWVLQMFEICVHARKCILHMTKNKYQQRHEFWTQTQLTQDTDIRRSNTPVSAWWESIPPFSQSILIGQEIFTESWHTL